MKIWKKNMVAVAVLVTVCAGIYANWVYAKSETGLTDVLEAEKVMSDDTLTLTGDVGAVASGTVTDTASDYFSAVRLSRQQARDDALNLLQEAMTYSDEKKAAESAVELDDIVETALSEAQIESLIMAKGYRECVAYMTSSGISVAVASPEGGLQEGDVALISDVVMSQTDFGLDHIRIVEVQ